MLYTEPNVILDEDSLELCFFFIPQHKVFSEFGVTLHPQYNISVNSYSLEDENLEIKINKKQDFIDLFENEQVSIKIICGRNGSGKSTLLRLLGGREQPERNHFKIKRKSKIETKSKFQEIISNLPEYDDRYQCIYVYKDKNENFASSEPISAIIECKRKILNWDKNYINALPKTVCVTHQNMGIEGFAVEKNILSHYLRNTNIFNGILPDNQPLFNKFQIVLWNFKDNIDGIKASHVKDLFMFETDWDIEQRLQSDWLLYFFVNTLRDVSYISVVRDIKAGFKEFDSRSEDIFTFIERFLSNEHEKLYDGIQKDLKILEEKVYDISEYDIANSDLATVENKMNTLLNKVLGEVNRPISPSFSGDFVYFKAYYELNGTQRFFSDLSTGEQLQFINRYQIFHSMCQPERLFWYIDEPTMALHPEWCRTFIYDYLKTYQGMKEYIEKNKQYLTSSQPFNKDKRVLLLFSTHSPFLLSDVTDDYVIYLEKDDETGFTRQVFKNKNCFSGNIGEIFTENFFMQETIGKFAKETIKKIIKNIDRKEPLEENLVMKYRSIINSVGDDLLRTLLQDKLERKIETDKADR